MRTGAIAVMSVVLAVVCTPSEIQARTDQTNKQPIVLIPEIMDSWNQQVLFGEGKDEWRFLPGTKAWDELITELNKQGYTRGENLFVAHYDWTASLSNIRGEYIAPTLSKAREANKADKVKVVGHGVGGLLARSYIAENKKTHGISHLALVGTPHYGMLDMLLTKEWGMLDRGWVDHQEMLIRNLVLHETQQSGDRSSIQQVFSDILALSNQTTPLLRGHELLRGDRRIPRTGMDIFSEYEQSPENVNERRTQLKNQYENTFLRDLQKQEFWNSSLKGMKVTNIYDEDGAPQTATTSSKMADLTDTIRIFRKVRSVSGTPRVSATDNFTKRRRACPVIRAAKKRTGKVLPGVKKCLSMFKNGIIRLRPVWHAIDHSSYEAFAPCSGGWSLICPRWNSIEISFLVVPTTRIPSRYLFR